MTIALVLFFAGLLSSAFFSGSETGLYRVPRTRLILDGLSGSRAAKALVWLLNHPEIFVATMLVGNNLANYLVSFAIVYGVAVLFTASSAAELAASMASTPVVFVFGELLPKYLFYQAPYRSLRRVQPLLLVVTVLFAPITILLGLLGNALRMLTGKAPFQLQLAMARGELEQVLRAGHEAGILEPGQRSLAQRIFEIGNLPAVSYGVPPDRLAIVDLPLDVDAARYQSRRRNHPIVLTRRGNRITGYVLYADLCIREGIPEPAKVVRGKVTDRHLKILLRLYDTGSEVAVLYDEHNTARSVVTRRQLIQPLVK